METIKEKITASMNVETEIPRLASYEMCLNHIDKELQDYIFPRVPKKVKLSEILKRIEECIGEKPTVSKGIFTTHINCNNLGETVFSFLTREIDEHKVTSVSTWLPKDMQIYEFGTIIEVDV